MLKRETMVHLQWMLWLVVLAFVLLVFVDFGGARTSLTGGQTVAASVGDHDVTIREFQRQYRQSEAQARQLYGEQFTPELARQMGLAIQALDTSIAQKLLASEAVASGLEVTDEEVRRAVLESPVFQNETGGFIGEEEYLRILRANRLTPAEHEGDIRQQLLIGKLNQVLRDTVYLSPEEVETAYREQVERAAIRYVVAGPAAFADQVEVTPEDVEAYFDEHKADYQLPERRAVSYIIGEPRMLNDTIPVEDSEIEAFYDSHRADFVQEERARARHILLIAETPDDLPAVRQRAEELKGRLQAGAEFGELAKEFSQDEATRDQGGNLGFFQRGRYNPALEDAIFSAQPGDLLGPVETGLLTGTGVHLVEVLDVRQGGQLDLEQVRPRVRARVLAEKTAGAAEEIVKSLGERIKESDGVADLATLAAETDGARLETTQPFGRDDSIPGIGRGTPFTDTAFSLEKGKISDPIQIARGWVILEVDDVQEAGVPELDQVRAEVQGDVRASKQKGIAERELSDRLAKLEAGETTMEQVAADLGVEPQESDDFTRNGFIQGLGAQPDLTELAFSSPVGSFGGPVETTNGPVIFEVLRRREMDPAEFAENRRSTREQLVQQRLTELLQSVIERRRRELEVNYNRSLLEELQLLDNTDAATS